VILRSSAEKWGTVSFYDSAEVGIRGVHK